MGQTTEFVLIFESCKKLQFLTPMPKPEQILAKLDDDRYFSTFDGAKGYWQIPISEGDKV